MKISLGTAVNLLKAHRHRTGFLQGLEEHFVLRHIAGQLIDTDGRQGLSVRLTDIEDIYHLEGGHQDFSGFLLTGSIRIHEDFSGDRILLIDLHFLFVRCRCKNANAAFTLLHLAAELLLPGSVTGHKGGVRLLHGDENRVVQRIIMKLGQGLQVLSEFVTFEERLDSCLQLIGNGFYFLKLRGIGLICFQCAFPPFVLRLFSNSRLKFAFPFSSVERISVAL